MAIKAKYRLVRPENTEATLELTMLVSEWRTFLRQINETTWLSWSIKRLISNVILKAEKEFEETSEQ